MRLISAVSGTEPKRPEPGAVHMSFSDMGCALNSSLVPAARCRVVKVTRFPIEEREAFAGCPGTFRGNGFWKRSSPPSRAGCPLHRWPKRPDLSLNQIRAGLVWVTGYGALQHAMPLTWIRDGYGVTDEPPDWIARERTAVHGLYTRALRLVTGTAEPQAHRTPEDPWIRLYLDQLTGCACFLNTAPMRVAHPCRQLCGKPSPRPV